MTCGLPGRNTSVYQYWESWPMLLNLKIIGSSTQSAATAAIGYGRALLQQRICRSGGSRLCASHGQRVEPRQARPGRLC